MNKTMQKHDSLDLQEKVTLKAPFSKYNPGTITKYRQTGKFPETELV